MVVAEAMEEGGPAEAAAGPSWAPPPPEASRCGVFAGRSLDSFQGFPLYHSGLLQWSLAPPLPPNPLLWTKQEVCRWASEVEGGVEWSGLGLDGASLLGLRPVELASRLGDPNLAARLIADLTRRIRLALAAANSLQRKGSFGV